MTDKDKPREQKDPSWNELLRMQGKMTPIDMKPGPDRSSEVKDK